VNNYTDWYTGVISPSLGSNVALGCCKDMEDRNCNQNIASMTLVEAQEKIYTRGCYTKLVETVEGEAMWLIIGGIILAIVQVSPNEI